MGHILDTDDIARVGNGELLLRDGGLHGVLGMEDLVEFLELEKSLLAFMSERISRG